MKTLFKALDKDFKPIGKEINKVVNEVVDMPQKALSEIGGIAKGSMLPIIVVGGVVLYFVVTK